MRREFARLKYGTFDLLVIGGGIYGAWVAYDAALRGLRVALVEKEDWASGTSSASSKLIHGGLRYLEHARLGLVRKTLKERRLLWQLAPHRVQPQRFVLPWYSGGRMGGLRLRLGLWLYDRLAGGEQPVEGRGFLSREAALQRFDFLDGLGLKGAFTYGDCVTDDARFVLELVDGAVAAGATAANRAQVVDLLRRGHRVAGAQVRDVETGDVAEVHAHVTANCTGAWSRDLVRLGRPHAEPVARLTRGVHLVLPPLPVSEAFLLPCRDDNRVIFLIPWYGRTLLGTTDTDYHESPDSLAVTQGDVHYLLGEANHVMQEKLWHPHDVISTFAGLRALPVTTQTSPSAVSREFSIEEPLENFITPVGGKFTSARVDSARVVSMAMARLGRQGRCATADTPSPWCPPAPFDLWLREARNRGLALGLDEETAAILRLRHGSRLAAIHALIAEDRSLALRIVPEAPFCRAEVVHAVREEMARSLTDIVRRRLPLALVSPLQEPTLQALADEAGLLLGWSAERRQQEVATLLVNNSAAVGAGTEG